MTIRIATALAAVIALGVLSSVAARAQPVLTYHGDAARSGRYTVPGLTREKARGLHREADFDAHITGHLYAQPLYWRAPGAEALLLTASEDDSVEALDARTGRQVWQRTLGKPVPRAALPCGNIDPLGITGTPVIDPSRQAIYVDAAVETAAGPRHEVFGLSLKDGALLPGWPVDVAAALQKIGRHFDPRTQNQRSALTLLDGTLYVAFGGHFGDCGDYHGWVVGFPLDHPGNVISFATRARGGGIWAPGGLSVVGHDLFAATGNTFGARTWSDGEAVFRLGSDLHRSDARKDYFAPSDWKALDDRDLDLGGSNPLPITLPGAGGGRGLLLALGKDGKAYLLDRNDLGGIGGELASQTVSQTRIITSPAAYPMGNASLVALQAPGARCPGSEAGSGLTVLKITGAERPTLSTAWCAALDGRGSVMVTTTDGVREPIVWVLGAEGDNRLHAFRGDTGRPIFSSEPLRGLRHFGTLIAAGNRLYVGADGRVYAFGF